MPLVLLGGSSIWPLSSAQRSALAFLQCEDPRGEIELEVNSDFSRIRVRRLGNTRVLSFVRDSGEEVVESMVDFDRRHDLLITYTRFMFLSYLFSPKPQNVLMIGLGGGAMTRFLEKYDPKAAMDVVEIDPIIIEVARRYFWVGERPGLKIVNQDGFEYLKSCNSKYDVIYMDAFLKPAADTDETGVPLRLKTLRFYADLQTKLNPGGVVVFNLNPHRDLVDDVKNIKEAFPNAYVFRMPGQEGLVVVGSTARARLKSGELLNRAAALDRRFRANFRFSDMARQVLQ
jgi:spermidine synthase